MQHRFSSGIAPLECKKQTHMASAFRSTFRRVNLSLMSCTSAELISVSARNKIQIKKLHLQTVENRSHFQTELILNSLNLINYNSM